jgi:hypothetical protein
MMSCGLAGVIEKKWNEKSRNSNRGLVWPFAHICSAGRAAPPPRRPPAAAGPDQIGLARLT